MDKKLIDLQAHLKKISAMFYKAKMPWKGIAFARVANNLNKFNTLEFKKGKLQTKIPSLGPAILDCIEQFYATGTSEKYKKLVNLMGEIDSSKLPSKKVVTDLINQIFHSIVESKIQWHFVGDLISHRQIKHAELIMDIKSDDHLTISKVWLALMCNGLDWNVRDPSSIAVRLNMENGFKLPLTIYFD